jgi:SpoVK/Ycf46/Vps4 family AAA+-type ATPase
MPSENTAVFELELELPHSSLTALPQRLVGFAARYEKLHTDLRILIDRDGLEKWSNDQYGKHISLLDVIADRYPLVIFHGDVGTGQTATAEAISNLVACDLKRDAMLFKLSTRVRGSGNVGEMSMLINRAFDIVIKEAGKARLSFLIIDEADSLATRRAASQSHHEDKVAVNTLIQRIDDIRRLNGRVLVFLCTNRYGSIDPAILRRAGYIEEFKRPNDREREELLQIDCEGLSFREQDLKKIVKLTGPDSQHHLTFTYSDIRTRLLPEALRRAFPSRRVTIEDLIEAARVTVPSPAIDSDDI